MRDVRAAKSMRIRAQDSTYPLLPGGAADYGASVHIPSEDPALLDPHIYIHLQVLRITGALIVDLKIRAIHAISPYRSFRKGIDLHPQGRHNLRCRTLLRGKHRKLTRRNF